MFTILNEVILYYQPQFSQLLMLAHRKIIYLATPSLTSEGIEKSPPGFLILLIINWTPWENKI